MATICAMKFSVPNSKGETFDFTTDVTVDDDGIFSLPIPEKLEPLAREKNQKEIRRFDLSRRGGKLIVSGDNLKAIKAFVTLVAHDFIAPPISNTLVLLYRANIDVAYVKRRDGELFPNGNFDLTSYQRGEAEWQGSLSPNRESGLYSVGLAAVVRQKRIYPDEAGLAVVYEHPDRDAARGTYIEKLNGFTGLEVKPDEMTEIPYSEKVAKLFYEAMVSICEFADDLAAFLANEERKSTASNMQ